MSEKMPNRPAGGHEEDFSDLNDWTVTDIANTPTAAPEDRKNAEAEIAKRKEADTYDPENAPHEVHDDFSAHGYGIYDGKILYPTPEYKAWLESDRSNPAPHGTIRESIEDRLETERQKAAETRETINAEHRQAFNRAIGENAIQAFENAPTREKIYPPKYGRKAKKEEASKIKIKTPPTEIADQPSEHIHNPELAEIRAEKLYNFYEDNFLKNAPRWISFGVSSLLEKGIVDPPTDSLLRSGFWSYEENRVHKRIDPKDTLSLETIDAEADLKKRVAKNLIEEKAQEISNDELRNAKRDGLLYAIYSGARVDERSGKVIYSIPSEKGNEVVSFMMKNEVNPNSENLQLMSQNGFISIIDAIKDDDKATEKGFETLDWYFDTFEYEKHMDELMTTIYEYGEQSDQAFRDKFDEYIAHRKELMEWGEQRPRKEDELIATLAKAENVSYDGLMSFIQEHMLEDSEESMFPYPSMNDRKGNRTPKKEVNYPSSIEKCTKAKSELEKICKLDPSAQYFIGTVFEEDSEGKKHKKRDYVVVRFGNNNFNNVIAIHIGNTSRAIFAWRGKTGEDADAWKKIWESSIRGRNPDICRFICKGYSERGALALNDQWERIWNYLNSPEKESEKEPV